MERDPQCNGFLTVVQSQYGSCDVCWCVLAIFMKAIHERRSWGIIVFTISEALFSVTKHITASLSRLGRYCAFSGEGSSNSV